MNELEQRYADSVFTRRNPEYAAQEYEERQSAMDQAVAAAKGVGSIASGIAAAAPAGVAGLATLPFKGMEGATQLIEDIQTALTYIPDDPESQAMVQRIGGALEKLGIPAQWVGQKVLDVTGSPAAATAAEIVLDPLNIAGAGAVAAIKPAAKAVGKVAKKAAENAAKGTPKPSGSLAAQRGAVGDLSQDNIYQWRDSFWQKVKDGQPQKEQSGFYRAMSQEEFDALTRDGVLKPTRTDEPGIFVTDDPDRVSIKGKGSYGARNGGVIVRIKDQPTIKIPSRTMNFDEIGLPEIKLADIEMAWDQKTGNNIKVGDGRTAVQTAITPVEGAKNGGKNAKKPKGAK